MAVWLCGPVLSLIDTSAVGVFSGTVQQAALSPAVAIVDYTSLCLAFMFAGTTNLIAGKDTNPCPTSKEGSLSPAAKVMRSSLQLSLRVGVLAMLGMIISSSTLLKLLIGNDGMDPRVYQAALKYVRIRAIGMPADVIMRSAQAACLGLKDIMSPLLVLVVAAVVNGLSDAFLVPSKFALFNGAAGAAWATVFSQYTAVVLYLKWLRYNKGEGEGFKVGNWLKFGRKGKGEGEENKAEAVVKAPKFTTKGMLAGKFRKRDLLNKVREERQTYTF